MKSKRIYFIDNLRWICVWLVVLFHVIDIFNSTGVPIHYNAPGIPQLDLIGYFVYPWFMALLFILAGISAKESLKVRSVREFAGNRFSQLMVPFIAYMAIFAIPTSAFCFSVSGGWADFASVPKGVLVIIMLCVGMGHAWFMLELYAVSAAFLPFIKLQNKEKFTHLCSSLGLVPILLFAIPLCFAAQVLNVIEVFRNLFYFLLFLLGFFVFSSEEIQMGLQKYSLPLLISALILFIPQAYINFGRGFAVSAKHPAAIIYGYVMCLALLGMGKKYLSFETPFTHYMAKRSFLIYLFHYFPMLITAYFTVNFMKLPIILEYTTVFVLSAAESVIISELIYRITPLRKLFGGR